MNKFNRPTMLMILDGYGLNENNDCNAIKAAKTPNLDKIFMTYPSTSLKACGSDVGLPDGQMGNSEVGHLNIGAGRIIYQELLKINNAISDKSFFKNKHLKDAMFHAKKNDSTLHLFGLLSDGGVHSHLNHLFALLDMAKDHNIKKVSIHCFLDGRDVPPSSAKKYISDLMAYMDKINLGEISTISGRYYAMDRDKRWDRLEMAYNAMTVNEGDHANDPISAIKTSYSNDVTDEFVLPVIINNSTLIDDNDAIIMFNFRPDRAREITRAFVDDTFNGFERKKHIKNLSYTCMTQYDATISNVQIAYPPETPSNTIGEYVSSLGMKQLRIAETEKYAHVTFFFNGGVEAPNKNEDRILIPSPKVATYDLQPEMSAPIVTEQVLTAIDTNEYDLIILNFANADMVGHTGIMSAAISAIEALDECVIKIVDSVLQKDGQILMTADHGNADVMCDKDGNPFTAHSLNDVPLVNISASPQSLQNGGRLCDIAPTLLELMKQAIPTEMTGRSLLK